ncbi:12-oxophytodienoate reductase [Polymorphospora sp. A560]|uniref:oxidoreductase n=1 Tax=Polymorphospora sp. A560 TaxID=3040203 RepID=UPI003892A547
MTTVTAKAPAPDDTLLFAPTTVAGLRLRSPFVMAPMTRLRSPDGVPTAEVAAYYRRRAAGGVGLVVTEGVYVGHPSAGHESAVPRLVPESATGWRAVVEAVHAEHGLIFPQLWHLGSEREPVDGRPAWTPSGVRENGAPRGRAMTLSDIDTIVSAFAASARLAHRLGFDGVEIHAAHGYLLDEFLWPATNRRTDRYGGPARDRARFVAEIVAAVRAATAPDFPISVRFSQFKERDYAARITDTPTELGSILAPFVAAGATLLHASGRRFWEPAFAGSPLNLAGWAKRLTGLPTITVGSVGLRRTTLDPAADHPGSLAALAARYRSGEFDLVALGRALLANPSWVHDVAQGRHERVVDYRKEQEDVFS